MIQINKDTMLKALGLLDERLNQSVRMIMGGGGAMVLAHNFPIGTYDIDAVPLHVDFSILEAAVKDIAKILNISADWLNPYFSTFAHVLPQNYESRLIQVFHGKHLTIDALGREDMLILKIFAGRQKDIPHAKLLLKAGVDINFIEKHLAVLKKKKIPGVDRALDFLDDVSVDN